VLHVGDADPAADNFALMRALPRVDVGLLPFWYVLDDANRRFVAESIRPGRIVAMHVPPGDVQKVSATLRDAQAGAVVAAQPGSDLAIGR
jgi:hypothetical protein